MICCAVPVTCLEDAENALKQAEGLCDLVELRVDFCDNPEKWLESFISGSSLPLIITDRCTEEGGSSPRTHDDRMSLLEKAAVWGSDYIDCEYAYINRLPEIPGDTKVIGSFHDFNGFPEHIGDIISSIEKSRTDIIKVAVTGSDICDSFILFREMQKVSKPIIALCMGPEGEISRIIGRKYGNFLTYASLPGSEGTAPGQLAAKELKMIYRYHDIDENTDVFGVAGNPVAHSASPDVHNAAFKADGVNGVYVKFLVSDMDRFMEYFKEFSFKGLSVTIPYKVEVMNSCESIDDLSRSAHAVNTVYADDGSYKGTNTDITAAISGLKELADGLRGKKVAVLGAGGVSRGICHGLKNEGAEITIINRTVSKAEALAANIGSGFGGYDGFTGEGFNIIINATSVGMHPDTDRSPVADDIIHEGMIVFDTIYNPPETMLIKAARSKGCRTLTGVDMFLKQAEHQYRIWFGHDAPAGVMKEAFEKKFEYNEA